MGNLMTSMYVGVSGLSASQNALNTTAHNLTNVGTSGYTRQQVLIQDTKYYSIGSSSIVSSNQVGIGTEIQVIRQVRDSFLDKSYRVEIGRQGFYQAQSNTVSEIEDLFGEMEGESFQDSIQNVWVAIEELSKEPESVVKRTTLVQTCVSFIERANLIANQLNEYQSSLNTSISEQVNRVNEIGKQISELNKKIRSIESAGIENANDYRDLRNQLLDELGSYAQISYKEDSKGVVTVSIEGTQFVTENGCNQMSLKENEEGTGMLEPYWKHTGETVFQLNRECSSDSNTDIGTLKGLLVSRGSTKANYTSIPVKPEKTENMTEEEYKVLYKEYEAAVEKYNNTVETSALMTVQAQFDQLVHGIVTTINDLLCPNKTMEIINAAGEKETIVVWDQENAPTAVGQDSTKPGEELFTRKNAGERYKEVEVTIINEDGNMETIKVYQYQEENASDPYSLYSITELEVNQNVLNNVGLIPMHKNDGSGEYDQELCEKLTGIWEKGFTTLSPNTLTTSTFKDYYASMIGALATRGNTVQSIATNQETLVSSVDSQRQQVMGVSSDEELTNMITFQHSYNAAARYVNVISEMLEHIITNLG